MKKVIGIISLLLSVTLATANPIDFDKAFKESAKIEKQIKRTSFPKRTYLITDFGAQPDTPDEPCHEAINRAILTCSLNGGGTVVVPKGTFHTGPITLKSNVNFHVEEGAVLKFSTDQSLYFPAVITRWEGLDCYNARPLIYAYGETNIAITGKGTIDGQGSNETWWPMCGAPRYGWKEGMVAQRNGGRERLLMYGETSTPVYKRIMKPEDGMRPQLINLYSCNSNLIPAFTIPSQNSFHAGRQLCQLKRFGDIVICSVLGYTPVVLRKPHRTWRTRIQPWSQRRRLRPGILQKRTDRELYLRYGRRLHSHQIRP